MTDIWVFSDCTGALGRDPPYSPTEEDPQGRKEHARTLRARHAATGAGRSEVDFYELAQKLCAPVLLGVPCPSHSASLGVADVELCLCPSSPLAQKSLRLFAVVVHIGRGPNHGHYVAVVKSGGRWLLFDDDIVEPVDEQVFDGITGFRQGESSTMLSATSVVYPENRQ